ncbi:DUF6415 family natural product biosynthesis protein [Streptomyces sp. NPDC053726]|uniref:DUF6415 family natural product biosynthesis protein n=1 Tax=Streptomyces sp. NPDC053726 TaxID=3365713 RepID=UPI0037D057B1
MFAAPGIRFAPRRQPVFLRLVASRFTPASPGVRSWAGRGHGKGRARDSVVAAAETVTLVLSEDTSVPASVQDVADLAEHLRGHLMRLGSEGPRTGPWAKALGAARELAEQAPSADDFPQSCVHLRRLALELKSVLDQTSSRPVSGSQR